MSAWIDRITDTLGRPLAVILAAIAVVLWGVAGPFLSFSDHWQLAVQTGTAVVTFLMIFCVQHTQSKDDAAMQAKLDELIRATNANNELIGIERTGRPTIEDKRERPTD